MKMLKYCLLGIAVIGVGLVLLTAWSSTLPPPPPPSERIEAACAKEYPHDLELQQRCELRLHLELVAEAEAARMDRARQSAQ